MSDQTPFDTSPIDPADHAALPLFDPPRRAKFLDCLAQSGNVRHAAAAAGISPQTAYRTRRADRGFAQLWDAGLLHARAAAEQVLADRALNGVEETVFYRGEEIGHRRRYDSRLLLAHLARLDRLAEQAEAAASSGESIDNFDAALAVLARGEEWRPANLADDPFGDESEPAPIMRAFRWLEAQGVDMSDERFALWELEDLDDEWLGEVWDEEEEEEPENPPRYGEGDHAKHGGWASTAPDPHDFRNWRAGKGSGGGDSGSARSHDLSAGPSTSFAGPPPPAGEEVVPLDTVPSVPSPEIAGENSAAHERTPASIEDAGAQSGAGSLGAEEVAD